MYDYLSLLTKKFQGKKKEKKTDNSRLNSESKTLHLLMH